MLGMRTEVDPAFFATFVGMYVRVGGWLTSRKV